MTLMIIMNIILTSPNRKESYLPVWLFQIDSVHLVSSSSNYFIVKNLDIEWENPSPLVVHTLLLA